MPPWLGPDTGCSCSRAMPRGSGAYLVRGRVSRGTVRAREVTGSGLGLGLGLGSGVGVGVARQRRIPREDEAARAEVLPVERDLEGVRVRVRVKVRARVRVRVERYLEGGGACGTRLCCSKQRRPVGRGADEPWLGLGSGSGSGSGLGVGLGLGSGLDVEGGDRPGSRPTWLLSR